MFNDYLRRAAHGFAVGAWIFAGAAAVAQTPAKQATPGSEPKKDGGSNTQAPAPAGPRSITFTVPEAAEYTVRPIPSPDARVQVHLPLGTFKDRKFTVSMDPTVLGSVPRIAVDNILTGNTAYLTFPPKDTVELLRTDFDRVRRVEITLTYQSHPVQIAQITVANAEANFKAAKSVDTTSRGMAVFDDVPVGKCKITAVYGEGFTQTQDAIVMSDHPGDRLSIMVPVTNKVATLDSQGSANPSNSEPATGATGPDSPVGRGATRPQTPDTGGGIAGFLTSLLGLGIIAGALYMLYKWSQTGQLSALLKKMGIDTSQATPPSAAGTPWQPNAPQAPVVEDPNKCQFCGQLRDSTGGCACTLGGSSAPAGFGAAPVSSSKPRLVGTVGVYSGEVFALQESGSVIGREPTNSISLIKDTTVSRRHAALRFDGSIWIVSDEGSSNGVFLNNMRLQSPSPIGPGDEVQIGNTRFRFEA